MGSNTHLVGAVILSMRHRGGKLVSLLEERMMEGEPSPYLAIGISGSSQHLAGCGSSQYIVANYKRVLSPIVEPVRGR